MSDRTDVIGATIEPARLLATAGAVAVVLSRDSESIQALNLSSSLALVRVKSVQGKQLVSPGAKAERVKLESEPWLLLEPLASAKLVVFTRIQDELEALLSKATKDSSQSDLANRMRNTLVNFVEGQLVEIGVAAKLGSADADTSSATFKVRMPESGKIYPG